MGRLELGLIFSTAVSWVTLGTAELSWSLISSFTELRNIHRAFDHCLMVMMVIVVMVVMLIMVMVLLVVMVMVVVVIVMMLVAVLLR